jgi:glycosyltransferase involved in cell wall biosynthesis
VVVPGQTGFLVPSDDPDGLAARLLELLRNPDMRKSMGEGGREAVRQRFTVDVMVRRMAGLYEDLLAKKRCVSSHRST